MTSGGRASGGGGAAPTCSPGTALATEGQVLCAVEGKVLHSHPGNECLDEQDSISLAGLSTLLQEGVLQNIRDGWLYIQGDTPHAMFM